MQLDRFFGANRGSPLAGADAGLRARLHVLEELRETPPGPWARMLGSILDEI